MKRQMPDPNNDRQLELPKTLKDELVRLYGVEVPVPPARNEAILAMARRQMVRQRRMRLILRRAVVVSAAAAVVALAVLLVRPDARSRPAGAPIRLAQNEPTAKAPNEANPSAPNEPKPSPSEISNLESEISSRAPSPKSLAPRGSAAQNEPRPSTRAASMALDPKDIDRNGRVNILDAFVLARLIATADQLQAARNVNAAEARGSLPDRQGAAPRQTNPPVSPAWDFNGDGVIDQKDVDTVAIAAVKLKGGAL